MAKYKKRNVQKQLLPSFSLEKTTKLWLSWSRIFLLKVICAHLPRIQFFIHKMAFHLQKNLLKWLKMNHQICLVCRVETTSLTRFLVLESESWTWRRTFAFPVGCVRVHVDATLNIRHTVAYDSTQRLENTYVTRAEPTKKENFVRAGLCKMKTSKTWTWTSARLGLKIEMQQTTRDTHQKTANTNAM